MIRMYQMETKSSLGAAVADKVRAQSNRIVIENYYMTQIRSERMTSTEF